MTTNKKNLQNKLRLLETIRKKDQNLYVTHQLRLFAMLMELAKRMVAS